MTNDTVTQETHTLQVWPSGRGYEYRGDPTGPRGQRKLRVHSYNGGTRARWRDGQPDEWQEILYSVRAEMYQARDVLGCDSLLVSELLRLADDLPTHDLQEGFGIEEIRNLYPTPDDWDDDECREWLEEHGHEVPSAIRQTSCEHCDLDVEGTIGGDDWRDRGNNTRCNDDAHAHAPTDPESDQDEYLEELRTAVKENDPEPAEVFEWWRVSSWLCDQLDTIGEVTIDNGYGHWWGRCCTGQAYIMDGVLQRVAAQFD